jgi:anti-anti-sigma factor
MNVIRLAFTEDFTIYRATEIKAALLAPLADAERIELDLTGVSRIDSAGCQLLILAKREANAAGKALAIVAHSPAVQSLIEFYNLAAWFGDPLVVAAR